MKGCKYVQALLDGKVLVDSDDDLYRKLGFRIAYRLVDGVYYSTSVHDNSPHRRWSVSESSLMEDLFNCEYRIFDAVDFECIYGR